MWFKNLAVYRFTEAFAASAEDLAQKMTQQRFKPCASHDEFSLGWTSPLTNGDESLVHAANGCLMICLKKQEKVIPSSVINEMLQERIAEIEDREARKLPHKERSRIKDELIFELLPKAFSFSKKTYAYLDTLNGWIIIDAASAKKAEDLLTLLRKSLGALPVAPIAAGLKPANIMTQWLLTGVTPKDILIEEECELRSQEEEAAIIRCKRQDLALPEIKNHLDNGKQVIKLAITWADRLSLVADENLLLKRLKFLDLVQEQLDSIETADELEQFAADFAIMSAEIAQLLPRLLELFTAE